MESHMKRRIASFIVSGIILAAAIALGTFDATALVVLLVAGVMLSAFASCLILTNNFLPDMIIEILSWGFVRMPGLITTLDLDGLIWLLTVKFLFWVLGFVLAVICGILAVILGSIVSVFVYPFAIYKNFTEAAGAKKADPEIDVSKMA